jgi:hypothetical protein
MLMKQHYLNALALFSLSLALSACGKDKTTTPDVDFGANEGYTGRDARWQLTSPNDPTDWTADVTWNNAEKDLFASDNLLFDVPMVPANVWKITLHPNPVALGSENQFTMWLDKTNPAIPNPPGGLLFSYKVVDARYNVLDWRESSGVDKNSGSIISYPASKFSANTLYRIYYVVFDKYERTVFYKGHGDVKVMP